MNIFIDFVLHQKAEEGVLEKFTDILPPQLIEVWKNYGFGSFMGGYLKIINPDEYIDLVEDGYEREDVESSIPILTTGFGDIIVWQNNKYVYRLSFKTDDAIALCSGFNFFFQDLEGNEFAPEELDIDDYKNAVEIKGEPKYDECFGYVPLLALGGKKSVDNLDIVKLREHILVILALTGPIVID